MIDAVQLKNFKCFRDLDLPLGKLSILTGLNGMGKSSVIQALLLIQQSYQSGDLEAGRLLLTGELVDLGTGEDILFDQAEEDEVVINLIRTSEPKSKSSTFRFMYDRESDLLEGRKFLGSVTSSEGAPFADGLSYLMAERLGPRKTLPLSESRVNRRDIGSRGEFVLHLLLHIGNVPLDTNDRRVRSAPSLRLVDQVDAWLQDISPGSHFDSETVRAADVGIAGYKFDREGDVQSRRFRATNVGFGLSYVLPVIVALLSCKRGSLLIIENPEAHLHPRGQTRLGQLAVLAAAAGVQVICETHSDHFLDGVRIEVKDSHLPPSDIAIHYFGRRGSATILTSPKLNSDGRLNEWPEGFFDQHDENLSKLLAPRK